VTLALCIVSGGIAMGFLDTGGNVQLLRLWGTKSAPYMQALHFAFGIGALVAPLIAKPFLRATPSNGTSAELTTCTDKSDSRANMTDICGTSSTAVFQYSYSIAAIVLFIMGLNFMYFAFAVRFCPSKATHTTQTIEKGDNKNGIEKSGEPPHNRTYLRNDFWYAAQILSLMFVFYFFYVGIEVTYGGYVAAYAVCSLGFSKSTAAILTSVFWATSSLARIGFILLAACKLSPGMMMVIDVIGSITAMILLSAFLSSEVILWVGSAIMGASIASMFQQP
jgi:FHS family Na+ dependent glucose MFS transporter 1